MKLLLDAGADMNATTNRNQSALCLAVYDNNIQCVKALLKAGVHVNIEDNYGNNALASCVSDHFRNSVW